MLIIPRERDDMKTLSLILNNLEPCQKYLYFFCLVEMNTLNCITHTYAKKVNKILSVPHLPRRKEITTLVTKVDVLVDSFEDLIEHSIK